MPNYACSFYINHHRSYEIHISLAVCTDNMTDKHIMHRGATQWLLLSMDILFGLVCVSVTQQCIFSSRNCKRRQYNITLCKCHRNRSCTNTTPNHKSIRPCRVVFSCMLVYTIRIKSVFYPRLLILVLINANITISLPCCWYGVGVLTWM